MKLLTNFNDIWNTPTLTKDIKEDVLLNLEKLFKDNPAQLIYFTTLYNIFKDFIGELDEENIIKSKTGFKDTIVFTKLPNWFTIKTPLGNYNPDWAVLIEKDNEEKLYFVVESKGSSLNLDIRDVEWAKIRCAEEHFNSFNSKVEVKQSNSFEHLMGSV